MLFFKKAKQLENMGAKLLPNGDYQLVEIACGMRVLKIFCDPSGSGLYEIKHVKFLGDDDDDKTTGQ